MRREHDTAGLTRFLNPGESLQMNEHERLTGEIVVDRFSDRGFGFAKTNKLPHDIFLHVKNCRHLVDHLKVGTKISFALGRDPFRQRIMAVDIQLA